MALAAHERLLVLFERTIVSIQHQLRSGQPGLSRSSERRGRMLGMQAFMASATAQAVMLVKLLSHLFDRLDHAFGPLSAPSSFRSVPMDAGVLYTPTSLTASPRSLAAASSPAIRHDITVDVGCDFDGERLPAV